MAAIVAGKATNNTIRLLIDQNQCHAEGIRARIGIGTGRGVGNGLAVSGAQGKGHADINLGDAQYRIDRRAHQFLEALQRGRRISLDEALEICAELPNAQVHSLIRGLCRAGVLFKGI